MTSTVTSFGAILLILSLLSPAQAARNGDDCQGDLFGSYNFLRTPKPQKTNTTPRYNDLPFLQKRIWDIEANGNGEQADFMRRRLEVQLTLTRGAKSITSIGHHQLLQVTDVSLAIYRMQEQGLKELAAYELNEKLGRPVKIPVTVRYGEGSLQLWLFYDSKDEMLSQSEHDRLTAKVAAHDDLFLFNFLVSNSDQNSQNLVFDRDAGIVASDFGASFRFSMQNYIYFSTPKAERLKPLEEISRQEVAEILKQRLARSNTEWASVLNKLDMDSILDWANRRLGSMNARELAGRICFLKSVVNDLTLDHCPFP